MAEKPKSSPRKSPPAKRKARPRRLWVVYLLFLTAGLCGVAAQWAWSELRRADQQPDPIELTMTYINSQNQTIEALIRQTEVAIVSRTVRAAQITDATATAVASSTFAAVSTQAIISARQTATAQSIDCEAQYRESRRSDQLSATIMNAFQQRSISDIQVQGYVLGYYIICEPIQINPPAFVSQEAVLIVLHRDSAAVIGDNLTVILRVLNGVDLGSAEDGEIQITFVLPTETRTLRALYTTAIEAWRSGVRGDALIAVFTIVTQ